MKTFLLLLLLTLITGSEADSQEFEVKACEGGWVDFICRYPKGNQGYRAVGVEFKTRSLNTDVENEWKHSKGLSVFHNTTSKSLRVIIRGLGPNDFGDSECKFFQNRGEEKEVEVKVQKVKNVCSSPSTQTVYTGTQTSITCEFPVKLNNWVKFLCKGNGVTCEDVSTTESSQPSNGKVRLKKPISNVSKQHEGVYWCGLKPKGGIYRAGVKQQQLEVKVSPSASLPSITTSTASVTTSTASVTTSTASITTSTASETTPTSPVSPSASLPSENTPLPSGTTPTSPAVSSLAIIIPVVIFVVVLLIIFILLYKRFKFLNNRKEGLMKMDKEERTYEEIQERPPQTNSGAVLNSIYTTAQHPTVPSAPALHSNSAGTNSGEVNDQTYSTAWDATQSPTYSTVNPPTTLFDDPFYSKLSHPQQP